MDILFTISLFLCLINFFICIITGCLIGLDICNKMILRLYIIAVFNSVCFFILCLILALIGGYFVI